MDEDINPEGHPEDPIPLLPPVILGRPDPANLFLLTNELKSLKKRLYSCELKGLELREKAMKHFCTNPQSPMALLLSSAGVPGSSQASSAAADVNYADAFTHETPGPLKNEYLLEQIASHLPMPELRNMRLVCRLWGKEFFRAISSRKPLLVSDDKSDVAKAEALIRKRTAGGVHNNVHISTLILLETPLRLRMPPLLRSLVFHFGDTISGLRVDDCYPSGLELYHLVNRLPYLESLCLKSTIRRLEDVQVDFGRTSSVLDSLLNVQPQIRQPVLKKFYWEDLKSIKQFGQLPDALPSLTVLKIDKVWYQLVQRNKKDWPYLRDLKINFQPRSGDAPTPTGYELPLKTLTHRINMPALRKLTLTNLRTREFRELKVLSKLLKKVRLTIEELDLVGGMSRTDSIKTLPPVDIFPSGENEGFPNLRILSCEVTLLNSVKIFSELLSPSLVSVNLSVCNGNNYLYWWKLLNNYKVGLKTINKKVRNAVLGSIDSGCLQKISTGLFPCLTTLEVSDDLVGDQALRTIFCGFKDLENLKVCQGSRQKEVTVTDFGLTGIPTEKLLKFNPEDSIPDTVKEEDNWIGQLQKLRRLDLGALTKCEEITDFSIHWGLAAISSVQVVVMPENSKTQISASALSKLKLKFLNHRWRGDDTVSENEEKLTRGILDISGISYNSSDGAAVARVLSLNF